MNKKIKVNYRLHKIVILLFFFAFILNASVLECRAAETDVGDIYGEIDGIIEDFTDAVPDGLQDMADTEKLTESVGIKEILSGVISGVRGQGGELVAFLLILLAVGLMTSLASLGGGETSAFASRAVGIVCSAMLFERLIALIDGAVSSLCEINEFFSAVIPVALAVNSLGVSPTTASTQATGMGLTLSLYSYLGVEVLGTLVGVIFVLSSASSIDPLFAALSRNVRNLFLSFIGILTALVSACFALQSTISSSADTAMMRSARYAVSSSVPIVGSTVSGALNMLAGGVAYARGIVGGGAIAVVLTLMLAPMVTILAYRFCLKIGIFFCSVSGGGEGILSPFLFALDTLLAVYSLTATLYVVELVAFLKGGGGLA